MQTFPFDLILADGSHKHYDITAANIEAARCKLASIVAKDNVDLSHGKNWQRISGRPTLGVGSEELI